MAQGRRREVSDGLPTRGKNYRRAVVQGDARDGGKNRNRRAGAQSSTSNNSGVPKRAGGTGNGSSRGPVVGSAAHGREKRLKVNTAFSTHAQEAYKSFETVSYDVRKMIRENLTLHKMEHGPETRVFRDDRGDLSVLHVSDVQGKCLRRMQLAHRFGAKMVESPIWASLGLTFAMGTAIEKFIIERVLLKSPKTVFGDWKCRCGHYKVQKKTHEEIEDHQDCEHCGSHLTYTGLCVMNDKSGIVGNVDLAFKANDYVYLVEIKSIKGKSTDAFIGWDKIEEPLTQHKQQIVTYWFMAAEEGLPMSEQVSVLYANKEYMFGNPFKEFAVKPLRDRNPLLAHEIFDNANEFHARKENGDLFNRLSECANEYSNRAKKCDQCIACFEMAEPERESNE